MAKFETIKSDIDFIEQTAPVVAITLKPELLEEYLNETKEAKAKRLKVKTWKEFDSLVAKDQPKKGYECIENTVKIGDEDDPILDSEKYVVVTKIGLIYLSDLPDKIKNQLSLGVRFMDDEGGISIIPNDPSMFETTIDKATDFYSAVDQYEVAYNGLLKIAEQMLYGEEPVSVPETVEEQLVVSVPETTQIQQTEIDEKPESMNTEVVEKSIDNSEVIEKISEQKESLDNDKQAVAYSAIDSVEDYSKLLAENIKSKFISVDLELPKEPIVLDSDMRAVEEVKPLLYLVESAINTRVEGANKQLEIIRENSFSVLVDHGEEVLNQNLEQISLKTSLEKENEYTNLLKEAQSAFKEEHSKIDDLVIEKSNIIRADYEKAKQSFIDEKIKQLVLEFDNEHLHKVKKQEDEFRTATELHLENQYQNAVEDIKQKAKNKEIEEKSKVVERTLKALKTDIESKLAEYQESSLAVVEDVRKENEIELKTTKEQARDIVLKYYSNHANVEKEVEKNTEALTSSLSQKNTKIEQLRSEINSVTKMMDSYKEANEKLEEQSKSLREDLSRSRRDLADVLVKAKNVVSEKEDNETSTSKMKDFGNKRMATIIAVAGMACGTILGSSYFITHNEAHAQSGTTISQVENSVSTKQTSSSSEDMYQAKPTTEFKVGNDVDISVDGKVTKATVESIDGNYATVKTPDGNQFRIQGNLGKK